MTSPHTHVGAATAPAAAAGDPEHWALLSPDDRATARAGRRCLDDIAPLIADAERNRRFPTDVVPALLAAGFVRGGLPVAHGGLGYSHLQTSLLMEEAGRCWGSVRTTTNILTLVAELLSLAGTEEQREQYLGPLLAGERMGWFAITEPDAGSDAAALTTHAESQPDGSYRLTGRKTSITNADYGDFGIVLATVDPALGARGITAFIVERSAGYQVTTRAQLPVQAVSSCDVDLASVPVPPGNVLGDVGRGLSLAMQAVNGGRLNVAAGCTGLAQAALEASIAHTTTRTQFGKSLASFQLVQQLVVGIASRAHASRAVYQTAARALDAGFDGRTQCSLAKYFCSEAANGAATDLVQLFGAAGLVEGSVPERLFRDARESTIPEGTTQMQVLSIGRALLGVSAIR